MPTLKFYIIFTLCFFSSFLIGQETDLLSISDNFQANISFLVDSTNQQTFKSIKKSKDFIFLSKTLKVRPHQAVWVKISTVSNEEIRYISAGNFDYVEMYVDKGIEDYKRLLNGRLTPLKDRVVNGFPILFPLSKEDVGHPIFLKFNTKIH